MSEPQGNINASIKNGPDFETTGVSPESFEAAKAEAAKAYYMKPDQVRCSTGLTA